MLTYRLQPRRIEIGKLPDFPAEALVQMELEPKVPFGGLAGPSRTLPKGGCVQLKGNKARGTFATHLEEPLYPPLKFAQLFDENDAHQSEISAYGNVLAIKFMCSSLENLMSRIVLFENIFPAMLTVFVPDAPYVVKITGTLAGRKFFCGYDADVFRVGTVVATAEGQQENICNSYGMMLVSYGKSRLSMGFYYFYQGCRLLSAGNNQFEFSGEVILNFTRALQSLFGESKDKVRTGLRGLGYDDKEIEGKFFPLFELRNNFDSGHNSLRILEVEDLDLIHEYVREVEEWMRELMKSIIKRVKGRRSLSIPVDPNTELSGEQKRVLRKIRRSFEPFRPKKAESE